MAHPQPGDAVAEHRPHIVVVTAILPWPLESGGQVRQWQLLDAARARYRVTLVVDRLGDGTAAHRAGLARVWPDVRVLPLSAAGVEDAPTTLPPGRLLMRRLRERLDPRRSLVRGHRFPETVAALTDAMSGGADLLQVEFIHAFRYVPAQVACPVVLVAHDIVSRRDRAARRRSGAGDHVALTGWRGRRHERQSLRRADVVIVTGDVDARSATQAGARRVRVIANGAPDALFDVPPGADGRKVIFVAAERHEPNRDAVAWWSSAVVPLLDGAISLQLAGRGWQARSQHPSIAVLGFVDDIQALYSDAVVVAPLRVGGGTKVKMVEAMAAARPIVATSVATEGLPLRDGVNVLIRDDAAGFASAVTALLGDADLRLRLGRAARDSAQSFSWSQLRGESLALYAELLG